MIIPKSVGNGHILDSRYWVYSIILTSLISQVYCVNNGGTIDIDISSYNATTWVFKQYETLNGNAEININQVPNDVGFFIIQVHSHVQPIVLSNTSMPELHSVINGTNVGLVQWTNDASSFKFYIQASEYYNISILVVVVAYNSEAPVPGGCNLTFNVELAPYQVVSYTDSLIRVDVQAASVDGHYCEENVAELDMYHMFLDEWDLSPYSYFQGIEKMLTVDDIIEYGRKVPAATGYFYLRRYYCAYQGTGSIFAVVAKYGNMSSAYVPAMSYACDIMNGVESCYGPVTTYWKIACGVMVFIGLFMCLFGHRFFQVTLFFVGFVVAAVLTYISVSFTTITVGETFITLAVIGFLYGLFWIFIWWKFGIPLLSITLSFVVLGLLVASVFFHMGLADVQVFRNDVNYWSVLVGIMLVMTLVLLALSPLNSNIYATSFLGSYIFIVPIDHYIGGNLRYIFLNTLHRATIPHFNLAVIDPPYQSSDRNLAIFWFLLTIAGIYAQFRYNKRRAPFPPPPVFTTERTPLLRGGNTYVY